jgi:hypothetical protein
MAAAVALGGVRPQSIRQAVDRRRHPRRKSSEMDGKQDVSISAYHAVFAFGLR